MAFYQFTSRVLTPLFRPALKRIEGFERLPKEGGYLIAANHVDYLDGFFVALAVFLRKPRLVKFLTETKNYWWTGGATIAVDQHDKAGSLAKAYAALEAGKVVCIFPEGRRNPEATLLPGKTGLARLALWSGLPVLPIGILGYSGTTFQDSVKHVLMKRGSVELRIGTPMTFPQCAPEAITKPLLTMTTTAIMRAVASVAEKTYTP